MLGGGHPVLRQHRHRQLVPATRIHLQHRRASAAPVPCGADLLWHRLSRSQQQSAPTGPPTVEARPGSRCDNTAPDHACNPSVDTADNPADNCPRLYGG
ncbi:hypothetical protein GCM10010377_81470 [Streptomyces viridiviolaceus]|nr:hypothetical protein GCM10010377_81470 [Streptomyces viridiviolaceus]